VEIISNADHFFEGRLEEMKRVITDWIKERMEKVQNSEWWEKRFQVGRAL